MSTSMHSEPIDQQRPSPSPLPDSGDRLTSPGLSPATTITMAIALLLFGICLALVFIEVIFRLFASVPKRTWLDRPEQYFAAEAAATMQDYAYPTAKAAGTLRIAVVGDSFTFAPYMQFDDAFPKRLERWLNLNQRQRKVEVINYGVPAYSTNHEVPVVERALSQGADLVLMQITLNDPELKPYTPTEMMTENKFGDLVLEGKIYQWWHTLAWVRTRLHNQKTHRNYREKFFKLFEGRKTWSNFENSFRKIEQLGREHKIPVMAVVFPLFGLPVDEHYPFWPIHQKVAALMSELAIPQLDITEIYRNIPVERLQVMPGRDFHPNEIGHRMAAEAMYRWLKESGKLPQEIFARSTSPQRLGIRKPVAPTAEPQSRAT